MINKVSNNYNKNRNITFGDTFTEGAQWVIIHNADIFKPARGAVKKLLGNGRDYVIDMDYAPKFLALDECPRLTVHDAHGNFVRSFQNQPVDSGSKGDLPEWLIKYAEEAEKEDDALSPIRAFRRMFKLEKQ